MFDAILSKYRLKLQMYLTPDEIDALKSATPQTLHSVLQRRNDQHPGRIIDRLVYERFTYITSIFTTELLNHYSLKQWIQSLLELPNTEIVEILTARSITVDSSPQLEHYSVLNFPASFLEFNSELFAQLGKVLQKLNHADKRKVLLSTSQSSTPWAFLILAHYKGCADEVLAAINDPELTAEMLEYLHMHQTRRLAAHFLGIKDEGQRFNASTNQSTGASQKFEYQGMSTKSALVPFRSILRKYEPSPAFANEFNTIVDAYTRSEHAKVDQHAKDYAEGKWIFLPSGWPRHAVFIAANQSFLVVANRGRGKHAKGGCIVYKLNKPLTDAEIQVILQMESQAKVEATIKNITKTEAGASEFVALPLSGQKYGNCTIANQKALVAGLLAILGILKSSDQNPDTPENKAAIEASYREYKRFTQYTRSQIIDMLIKGSADPKLRSDFLEAVRQYLTQHVDLDKESERQLVFELLQKLPNDILDATLETMNPEEKKRVRYTQRVKSLQQNDSSVTTEEKRAMLADAIEYNQESIVLDLLKRGNLINEQDNQGRTPLMHASSLNNMNMVLLFLNNGAVVNTQDRGENVALTHIIRDCSRELALALEFATPSTSKQRVNRLLQAVRTGNQNHALACLTTGADINGTNKYGETALMVAAEEGDLEMAKLLIANGADCLLVDKSGDTAAEIAQINSHHDVAAMIKQAIQDEKQRKQEAAILNKCGSGRIDSDTQTLIDAHVSQIQAAAAIQSPLPQKAEAITHQAKKSNPPSDTKQQSSAPHQNASTSQPLKKK